MDVCRVALHGTKRISSKVSVSGVLWNEQFIGLQNLTCVKPLPLWRSFIGYRIVRTCKCWPHHWKLKFCKDICVPVSLENDCGFPERFLGVSEDNAFNSWMLLPFCLFACLLRYLIFCLTTVQIFFFAATTVQNFTLQLNSRKIYEAKFVTWITCVQLARYDHKKFESGVNAIVFSVRFEIK